MVADDNARIEQFRKMTEADPNNELGHFSLGKALVEASRFQEAAKPLSRALALNPALSKAYQLLGDAWAKQGDTAKAVEILTRGVLVADEQGDRAPRDAMAARLNELGAPTPAFRKASDAKAASSSASGDVGDFRCARCGRPKGRLAKPPFKGALGEKIHQHVCESCWREWIGMGTKVINELGLVMSNPESQATYDQYMIEFLQLEDR
jgi:Fe-S cluster biosynthesis and repair protein YggX